VGIHLDGGRILPKVGNADGMENNLNGGTMSGKISYPHPLSSYLLLLYLFKLTKNKKIKIQKE
jgi:hypothetical protein